MSHINKILNLLKESDIDDPFVLYYDKSNKNSIKLVNKFKKDTWVKDNVTFIKGTDKFNSKLSQDKLQKVIDEIADELNLIDGLVNIGYVSGK